ncbi:hypothetical protein MAM1_0012c01217 [Mucor ambiguus]|uniref:Uncharacterized protein n=1 Tax=Mucor ambiguus TaxID=91626 RepID=A0A0C9MFF3_9FUNG|nr:hypothetical protein MAM1_0012c01217 [Mucor ambiguus]
MVNSFSNRFTPCTPRLMLADKVHLTSPRETFIWHYLFNQVIQDGIGLLKEANRLTQIPTGMAPLQVMKLNCKDLDDSVNSSDRTNNKCTLPCAAVDSRVVNNNNGTSISAKDKVINGHAEQEATNDVALPPTAKYSEIWMHLRPDFSRKKLF